MSILRVLLCVTTFSMIAGPAHSYPSRPIRMVVPYAPGGTSDLLSRLISQRLGNSLGQQVVVDNRAGAGGSVGAEIVSRASADGHTLVMASAGSHAVSASIINGLRYDPVRDFAPVILTVTLPSFFLVKSGLPASSIKEFIALAKAKPGQLTYSSSGVGSLQHLAGELFRIMAGIDIRHVPYKGGTPAMADLVAGRIDAGVGGIAVSLPHVKAGKLKALGVTSARRVPTAADIPTMAEAGVPGYEAVSWYGVLAPSGTPADIVAKLNREVGRILNDTEVRSRLLAWGMEAGGGSPQDFGTLIKVEVEKYKGLVKQLGI